jgi:hypothetical protein
VRQSVCLEFRIEHAVGRRDNLTLGTIILIAHDDVSPIFFWSHVGISRLPPANKLAARDTSALQRGAEQDSQGSSNT